MSATTQIQWTDATWNPVRGCSRVSEGCRHCYAEGIAARVSGEGQAYHGLARRRSNGEPQWTGAIQQLPERLRDPLRWRKPRRVFVNSMSDLFHEGVSDLFIAAVWDIMARAPRHTFQVLTKRPERMRTLLPTLAAEHTARDGSGWPLPNVWLGVSVENQEAADERIPLLMETPAAVRFLSCEPLLGPISIDFDDIALRAWDGRRVDWCIIGGESGRGARPLDIRWVASLVAQCRRFGVAPFVKQLGAVPMEPEEDWRGRATTRLLSAKNHGRVPEGFVPLALYDSKGGDPDFWPAELRVREFPGGAR
jgi:protein gp37